MITVSDQFKEAIYAPIRKTAAKVTFEILDNEAYEDNTITVTGEAPISRKSQLANKVRTMTNRYATFEQDYWKLDGSFYIPPVLGEDNSELSWWSGAICGSDGVFDPYQVIEFVFAGEHNSMGLTITFDVLANEYAADFDIDIYRADDSPVNHQAVTGNTKTVYALIHGLDNYGKIVITIKKWTNPYRRARITEIDFGVIKNYEGDKLISLNLIEEMAVIGDTIPINELRFTVDNSDKEFNILNPEGFYRFFKERQEISLSLGVEIFEGLFEYTDFKKYYLTDWQSDEGALTATFTARNIIELLDQREYVPAVTTNLYALAEDILLGAGVMEYYIDPALQAIPTGGFPEKISRRKALQCVGIAGKCAVYQDRQGISTIRRFENLDERTAYVNYAGEDMFCGMTFPSVIADYGLRNIDFDNAYEIPQIKLDSLVKSLTVVVYSGSERQEFVYFNAGISEGTSLKLDNPLIQSEAQAADVAGWILAESNLRALYSINWRQNPCLECGDTVLVEDNFGMKKASRIIKQEYNFQGYLVGKTETKGGV